MINISYIRLLNAFESFANAHMQIKRFAADFPEQMPNFGTANEKYPILFVSPDATIFDENSNQFTVTVRCFDIIEKDRTNINTILSDTNTILNDVYRWFKDGEIFGIDVIDNAPNSTPLNNALLDYAAGWEMQITFTVDTYGICEIPFNDSPVVITEVCDIVYSQYLTCETLENCAEIIGIQEELENHDERIIALENDPPSGLTCDDLPDCQTIIDIQALLPTSDQKSALDNSNGPDGSNPFATINDLPIVTTPNLSTVLAAGNSVGGYLIQDASGNSFITLNNSGLAVFYSATIYNHGYSVSETLVSLMWNNGTKNGGVDLSETDTTISHSDLVNLNSPSVKKNGVEVATLDDILLKVLTGLNITGSNILATDTILQAFGKVQNQINGVLGGAIYQGVWNATTNAPTLSDGTGTKGYYYVVSVAGTQNLGSGNIDFAVGDWVIHNGAIYQKVDNTDAVSSVNGFIGAVNLTTADIPEVTNLYFTQARVLSTVLSGYVSGAGIISSSDTVLSAINKLNGNIALKEDSSNKQTDLTASATKFPTVDAVNAGLLLKQNSLGFTPEDVANKQTDLTASATKYPTVNAVNVGLAERVANSLATAANDFIIASGAGVFVKKTLAETKTILGLVFGTGANQYTEGNDSRLSDSRYTKLLGKNVAPASGTNTTAEEVISTYQVPAGTVITGDILEFLAHIGWNATAGTKQFKLYFNVTADLSGSPALVATSVLHTTNLWSPFTRRFIVNSNTQIQSNIPANNALDIIDVVTAGTNIPTNITVPSLTAGFYVVITGTKNTGTDTDTVQYSFLRRMS